MTSYKKINVIKRQLERKKKRDEMRQLYQINEKINDLQVRVVEINGEKVNKICSREEALQLAEGKGLDLVKMPSNSTPPACKIVSASKFLYEQEKKEKKKINNKPVEEKTISFSSEINKNDLDVKRKHVEGFLKQGSRVKCILTFYGRAVNFKDFGFEKINSFINDLEEYGEAKEEPVFDGKRSIIVTLLPKAKKI